jgi:hypothetical protein
MKAKKVYEFRTSGEIISMGKNAILDKFEQYLINNNINYLKKNNKFIIKHRLTFNNDLWFIQSSSMFDIIINNISYIEALDITDIKNIKFLPSTLTISSWLEAPNSGIEYLDSKINGSINLDNTPIKEIRNEHFKTDGDLDLTNCTNITKLPKYLIVGGDLVLEYTNISELPPTIRVYNGLYIGKSKITKIPDNLNNFSETLDVSYSNVTELPENLMLRSTLNIEYTNIKKLPKTIYIAESLLASNSALEEFPNRTYFSWDVDISNTNITKLPDNLRIFKDFDIRNTPIKELPMDLYVKDKLKITKEQSKYLNIPSKLKDKTIIY